MPDAVVDLPEAYRDARGLVMIRHEEEALCWLWACPELLPWPRQICWLYTPVVGNTRWPGDLWGIDASGDLVVLECKQCRRADDPFRDFVRATTEKTIDTSALRWLDKFHGHLAAELTFPDGTTERPRGHTDGILPRSNRRAHVRRWPELGARIDQRIRARTYAAAAESFLRVRLAHEIAPVHFVALMVVSRADCSMLTAEAVSSAAELCKEVGGDCVSVVSIRAEVVPPRRVRIVADAAP